MTSGTTNYGGMMDGISDMTGSLDLFKTQLEEKGWDSIQAQMAAREFFHDSLQMSIAKMNAEATKSFNPFGRQG